MLKQSVLIDWKTGRDIYVEHLLQTAAYCGALSEEMDIPLSMWSRFLVSIRADGTYTPHEFKAGDGLEEDYQAFIKALGVWQRVKMLEKLLRKENKNEETL